MAIKQDKNLVRAPLGNTGVTHTMKSLNSVKNKGETANLKQFVLIDWLEFTIHHEFSVQLVNHNIYNNRDYVDSIYLEQQVYQLFNDLFGISSNDIVYDKRGRNCYTELYYYKNILCWTSQDIRMGFHFEISGQGCRLLELLNIDLFFLLAQLKNYICNFTRIDLSIDDFTNDYYTVSKLKEYLSNGQVISKLRTYYDIKSGVVEESGLLGNTLQLGSKAGLIHITFYDKLLERESNNYIISDDVKYWTRTEVRYRHEKAQDIVEYLIITRDINKCVKGVLKDYVRFVEKPNNDTNKWRRKTAKWWDKFLDNIDVIKLASHKVYTSIEKKKDFAGISGNKGDGLGNLLGSTFKGKYIDATNIQRRENNILGDKAEAYYTSVLKKFPFPEIRGENFMTEDIVWDKIAETGLKIRWFNDIIYIV